MSALRETLKSVRDVPHMLKVPFILQYKQILSEVLLIHFLVIILYCNDNPLTML